MNRKVSLILLAILIPVVISTHIGWTRKDNGLIFNVDGRDVDFVGAVKDKWRTTTKTCKVVSELYGRDPEFKLIKTAIQSFSPPESMAIREIYIWRSGDWAIAEVEFENLLPAVVPVMNLDTKTTVMGEAIWSGVTTPWKAGPFVRAYVSQRSSNMPAELLNCFELQTASFR